MLCLQGRQGAAQAAEREQALSERLQQAEEQRQAAVDARGAALGSAQQAKQQLVAQTEELCVVLQVGSQTDCAAELNAALCTVAWLQNLDMFWRDRGTMQAQCSGRAHVITSVPVTMVA